MQLVGKTGIEEEAALGAHSATPFAKPGRKRLLLL
jgi:hypothetical protein